MYPKDHLTLQWKGERTCMTQGLGPQNDARPLRGQDP